MDFIDFYAGKNDENRTLEKVIRKLLSHEPLTNIYKSHRNGFIKVNDKKVPLKQKLVENDKISVASFLVQNNIENQTKLDNKIQQKNNTLNNIQLENVFINENLRIINKPYGIPVQPSQKSQISLSEIIENDYKSIHLKINSISFTPGPLHRLDRNTTGLLVFSQSIEGAQKFSQAIKDGIIEKNYLTLLQGKLEKNLTLKNYIKKNNNSSSKFHTVSIYNTKIPDSDLAITNVFPIANGKINNINVTFAKVQILTGKTHQIRSQCANAGFPLFGDIAYNGISFKDKDIKQDFFLHAYELISESSLDIGLPKKIYAGIPKDFEKILKKFLREMDIKPYNGNDYEYN